MDNHDNFIQTTRTIAEMTGETPNSFRVALRRFAREQTAQQQKLAQKPEGTVPVFLNLSKDNGAMSTTPRPFTSREQTMNPGAGANSDANDTLKDVVYLDTDDGLLYYTDLYYTGRKDPV